jgi:hypothetical protein
MILAKMPMIFCPNVFRKAQVIKSTSFFIKVQVLTKEQILREGEGGGSFKNFNV